MKNSQKFWIAVYCLYMLIGNYYLYKFLEKQIVSGEKQYCGIVIKKSDEEVSIKHGSKTQLYLIVDFNVPVGIKSILVEPNTYFTKERGDNVCFRLSEREVNGTLRNCISCDIKDLLFFIFIIITCFADLIIGFAFLSLAVEFINNLLNK